MLRKTALILSCSLILFGCKKDHDNTTNTSKTPANPTQPTKPTEPVQDSSYIIVGVKDVNLTGPTDEQEIPLAFSAVSSAQKHITLSTEGLPAGVTSSFSTSQGIVPFLSDITLTNDFAEAGTYDVSLKGTAEDGLTKSLRFKLKVPPYTCTERLAAKSSGYRHAGTGMTGSNSISAPKFSTGTMTFASLYIETIDPGTQNAHSVNIPYVDITVNCDSKTLTMSKAQYGIYTYSGSGTFSFIDKKLHLDYTVTSPAKTMNFTIDASIE